MSQLDVLVVGGGISGLASAHCLARAGLSVEVWESAERAGGKIHTSLKQGYQLDSAASMVMNFRSQVDHFLQTAGLESSKRERTPGNKRYVIDQGRLCEAPSSFGDLLTTPLFSTAGKLRLLAEPLVPRGRKVQESVADFVTRRLGKEFLDKVFEPYIAGPLANDVNSAEAQATMPKLVALERRYGSLAVGAFLRKAWSRGSAARPDVFSFNGGMGTLVDKLASQGGFHVRNSLKVSEVWPIKGGWMVRGLRGDKPHTIFTRQLIISTPPKAAARLVCGLDPHLARLLNAIEYSAVNVVHTGFRRSMIRHALNGSGFLVPRGSGFEPNGCLWISSLFPDHAPEGQVLLSSYLGGARNPAAVEFDAERSLDAVMQMLGALVGIKVAPEMLHIDRHTSALPLYHGAYSQRLDAIQRRLELLPGLYLEANYKGGVSVRDRILCAEVVAKRILRHLEQDSRFRASIQRPAIAPNLAPVSVTQQ